MEFFEAPTYTRAQLAELDESQVVFPFNDVDATYDGLTHQYQLTSAYFYERGRNLELEVSGTEPDKVNHFLKYLRMKVYNEIYAHNKSTRRQMNYIIAKRGIYGFSPYEYRQAFLEMMFIEGCYLLDNGDISSVSGVDLDTMQNMSADVVRNQDRDFHPDAIDLMKQLGLRYYGKYRIIPEDTGW